MVRIFFLFFLIILIKSNSSPTFMGSFYTVRKQLINGVNKFKLYCVILTIHSYNIVLIYNFFRSNVYNQHNNPQWYGPIDVGFMELRAILSP